MRKLTQPSNNSSSHYYNQNRTSSQQPIHKRSQELVKKQGGKHSDIQQQQNISKNNQQHQTSLSPSYSNQMLLSPGNKQKSGGKQNLNNYYHQQSHQNSQQGQHHHTQTSMSSGSTAIVTHGQHFHTHQNQNNQDILFSQGGVSDKLSGLGGTQSQIAASQIPSYLNQYHTSLNKQSNVNHIQNANIHNNIQSSNNSNQNQLFIGGTHSKKNSQSNIFSHKKSPQSQLNDIVLQNNRIQQNLGQKGIDQRYQKEQQFHQNQLFQLQQDQQLNDKQIANGDGIGKFQNEIKHFNQIIQNVERDSNIQKEQSSQQYTIQQLNQINKIHSPASNMQTQNISHRQSIATTSDEMKKSGVQGQQQVYQKQQLDYDTYQNNNINNFSQQNETYHITNQLNNNQDPNNVLKIMATKLQEITENFQSPGKKINTTSSSSQGNYPAIPPSAMKNSSVLIQSNQPYSSSMQSSRHASGNLYAATAAGGQQQQQGKQQIGYSNQNSLKYSQMINADKHIIGDKFITGDKVTSEDISDEAIQNNGQIKQHNYLQQQIPIMQLFQDQSLQHQSPARYLPNAYTKTLPQSMVTSVAATQKKSNQQNYQLQGKKNNQAIDRQNNDNGLDQEVKPFITDRAIYNQINAYQQLGQSQSTKINSEQNNQNTTQNKQARKGAFNNNLTKKKRHEMKEYRHFSSIDFKNSESNSIVTNLTYHNHNTSNSNNPNNTNPTINPNYSYIQNISQSNIQNQNNCNSANNTSRKQKQVMNSFISSSTKPLISIQEKHQLMQAHQMINSIAHPNFPNQLGNSMNQANQVQHIEESQIQEFNIPQLMQQSQQAGQTKQQTIGLLNGLVVSQNKQQNNSTNQQSGIGVVKTIKNGNIGVSKQIQNINQALLLQKQENSPIANISSRAANSNRSTTQRTQSNIIQNNNQQQLVSNSQSNQNNLNNNQPLNSAKSSGGSTTSTISGNKTVLQLLQPSSQQSTSNGGVFNSVNGQAQIASTTNTTNNSIQNKQISTIHNTNQNMQNNYLLNQKAGRISTTQSNALAASGNNSGINGSNSFGRLTQNLFSNISMNGNNLNKTNYNNNNNTNTTSSPSTQNVIKNSNSSLNIKISKQLQQQSQQNQHQQQLQQQIQISSAYKKQPGSTSFGGLQQPMSAKSGEQQIKERRKHSESTAIHSQSANNSKMITNLSQGKYFEEDFVNEASQPYYKNQYGGDRTSSKNSLKSSLVHQNTKNSNSNQVNSHGIVNKGLQYQQINNQGLGDSSVQPQLDKLHQIQQMLTIGNHINTSKTPDRDRFPSTTFATRKIEIIQQNNKINLQLKSSSKLNNFYINQQKDHLKSNSKITQDGKNVNTPKTDGNQQKNLFNYQNILQHNLIQGILNQSRANNELYPLNDNEVLGEVFENNLEEDQALLFSYQQFNNSDQLQNQQVHNPVQQIKEQIHNNNQEFTHHFNQIGQSYDQNSFQNQKNNYSQNILSHQIQQQNILKKQNPQTQVINKTLPTNTSNHQYQQQQQQIVSHHQQPLLNESKHTGSLDTSKANNYHQILINPTNNSFYNPIKFQSIDSVIIPNPSQVFHNEIAHDQVPTHVYYEPQNDESIGNYHEHADQNAIPIDSILSHSTGVNHPHFRTFSHENILPQNQKFVHNQIINEQILELDNQIQEKQDQYENQRTYLQSQNYIAGQVFPTSSYSGQENMQDLEKALQQQNIKQIKPQQSPHQISQQIIAKQNNTINTTDMWRETNYKQQEQDLKQFESAFVKQQTANINSPNIPTIPSVNKINKNLKQQLEECNTNLPPLLASMLNGDDKSGQKKTNYIIETSDKKRTKTPQNQNNKIQQSHHPLSCTNKKNFNLNSDEINMSLSSSAKKNKKPMPKSSPSGNQKMNNKNTNHQQKQSNLQKINGLPSNQKQTQNRSPSQIMSSSTKKSRGSPYSSQPSPKTHPQQVHGFKLNDIQDELYEEQNIDINFPVEDEEQFKFYNETLQEKEKFQHLLPTNYKNHFDSSQNHNHTLAQKLQDMGMSNKGNINLFDKLKNIDNDFAKFDHMKNQQYNKNINPHLQIKDNQLQYNNKKQIENKFIQEGSIYNSKIKHQFENNNYSDVVVIKSDSFPTQNSILNTELDQTLSDHRHKINCISYSYQDNIIFTGSHDYNLKAYTQTAANSPNFSCIQTIRHRRWVTSLEYITSHRLLLSGGGDGIIKLFSLQENRIKQNSKQQNQNNLDSGLNQSNTLNMVSFIKGNSGVISGINFLKNENRAFSSCGSDGFVNIWDLETLQIKTSWQIGSPISQQEYIPQNNILINLNQNNLTVLDIRSKGIIFSRENSDFTCVRNLPSFEGTFLVGTGEYSNLKSTSGSSSKSPYVLQFDIRKNLLDPTFIYQPLNGNRINCIETYEDQSICIFGTDQSLEYLNLVNNKVNILDSQSSYVNCLSIDPIHNKIYSGLQNHELRIYNII